MGGVATDTLESMTPDELVAVITAGLDADEQAAREAGRRRARRATRRWLVEDNTISLWPEDEHDGFMAWPTRADARHAYRHDPSRVLADVAAKREIIAEYRSVSNDFDESNDVDRAYMTSMTFTLRMLARPYLALER